MGIVWVIWCQFFAGDLKMNILVIDSFMAAYSTRIRQNMKSLLITHDFPPGLSGGISVFQHHLCTELKNEINVLAPKLGNWKAFDSKQEYTIFRQTMPKVPSGFMRNMKMRICHIAYLVYIAVFQFNLYLFPMFLQLSRPTKICGCNHSIHSIHIQFNGQADS